MESKVIESRFYQYGERLLNVANQMAHEPLGSLNEDGQRDPRVIALAILCRTLWNFRGAVIMLRNNQIIEARILARCCWENLIHVGALVLSGSDFVKQMIEDEMKSKGRRGEYMLRRAEKFDRSQGYEEKLRIFLLDLKQKFPKPRPLNLKGTAISGLVEDAYLYHAQYSSDAVHTSISALSRHIRLEDLDDGAALSMEIFPEPMMEELQETLQGICNALLGVCIGVAQLTGQTSANSQLRALHGEFQELSAVKQATVPQCA